ncbi:hypothetical protein Tcan_06263 [Toxocara canis]|uniref:Uncharacterized protein n=2 Tax=Toxocara canis TaxID=6265 RepID=A0A0B2URD2_TOXCA|nr:hypothetical protein Tcan_06263 [Toxocara canis]VDM25192.1 unnamed protein product [Toxocara canis]
MNAALVSGIGSLAYRDEGRCSNGKGKQENALKLMFGELQQAGVCVAHEVIPRACSRRQIPIPSRCDARLLGTHTLLDPSSLPVNTLIA